MRWATAAFVAASWSSSVVTLASSRSCRHRWCSSSNAVCSLLLRGERVCSLLLRGERVCSLLLRGEHPRDGGRRRRAFSVAASCAIARFPKLPRESDFDEAARALTHLRAVIALTRSGKAGQHENCTTSLKDCGLESLSVPNLRLAHHHTHRG